MPITPLHLGVGLAAKTAAPSRFSFTTFLVANVLLDVEPILTVALNSGAPLHSLTHTWAVGATIAVWSAVLVVAAGWVLRPARGSFWSIAAGATLGVASHLLLDAMYHADVAQALGLPGASGLVPQAAIDATLALLLAVFSIPYYMCARAWALRNCSKRRTP